MKRSELPDVVATALQKLGGTGSIVQVAKAIWDDHQKALASSGDLFFTWQYDIRWAAQKLRDAGRLQHNRVDGRAVWQLIR